MNPIEIDCPLVPQFHYETTLPNGSVATVTTVRAIFDPVVRRVTLMWIMFVAYLGLAAVGLLLWLQSAFGKNFGMALLQKLPIVDDDIKNCTFSDLNYLMQLVYVNQNRVKYLK